MKITIEPADKNWGTEVVDVHEDYQLACRSRGEKTAQQSDGTDGLVVPKVVSIWVFTVLEQ